MKNLKKTLAVVLAFAMILSMGFSAFAYTDVAEGTKVAEAVGILSNLNIFTGFEDGTFKPNDTVTRAQMAAIICRTLGYEDQAVASTGTTNFYDVPASHWASGYVNVAESLQIVNGYGNGAFGPEDQVTYEQAIKMIVVALGYELDAQAKGGWSTGYLAVAAREGITKNSNGVVGSPAARGTIAVLVYNSLEVPLMDQDVWTPTGKEDEYTKLPETILSRYLDVTKIEAVVDVVPYATFATNGYEADADLKVSFVAEDAKYYGFSGKVYKALDYKGEIEFDATYVPEINEMAGRKVVAYVGNEEDEELGARAVYAVAEKQGSNKVTVLSAAQLTDSKETNVIEYREVGSRTKKTLDLEIEINDKKEKKSVVEAVANFGTAGKVTINDNSDLAALVKNGGIITLISNDADSKIEKIFVTVYDDEAVVEEVKTEDGLITFKTFNGVEINDIDAEDEDVLNVVIKDGAVATVADIAANDTVSIIGENFKDDSFRIYYVSSKTVTGRVDSYGDDAVEIGGEDYELSPLSSYKNDKKELDTSKLANKEGIFFLNVDGQIAHDEATADKHYGIIIGAGSEGRKFLVEVVLADGTTATYELRDEVSVDGTSTDAADVIKGFTMTEKDGETWKMAIPSELKALVFDITIKDGKVRKLDTLKVDASETKAEYDEENMEFGAVAFDDATIIVSVEENLKKDGKTPEAVKAEDIRVGKVADYFIDGEGEGFKLWAYDVNKNSDAAGFVIGTGLDSAIAEDSAAFIFADYRTKSIDDEDAYVINGFQGGKAVSYTIFDEDYDVDAAGFKAGDVLLLGLANAEGMITDIEKLYTAKEGLAKGIAEKKGEYYYYGDVDAEKDTDGKFFFKGVPAEDYEDSEDAYASGKGVSLRNSANYTLVDFSEDAKDPEISKKSKSSSLFSRTDKYSYKVFVRYFDNSQAEVVVYRDVIKK